MVNTQTLVKYKAKTYKSNPKAAIFKEKLLPRVYIHVYVGCQHVASLSCHMHVHDRTAPLQPQPANIKPSSTNISVTFLLTTDNITLISHYQVDYMYNTCTIYIYCSLIVFVDTSHDSLYTCMHLSINICQEII